MPFTNEAIRTEIHEWIKRDGSKVGRIASATPLALNMHLVEVVWKGIQKMVSKPTVIYVCNTTLEAELLDRQLKDRSFHGGKIGEQSVVSRRDEALGDVVLMSYARFRQLLDAQAKAPSLPCRVVVICEQEPGRNMDAVVARGQFALLTRTTLARRAGHNVKMLGLSYNQYGGRDWLRHASKVMSTSPQQLSLDVDVSYGLDKPVPTPEQYDLSPKIMQQCIARAIEFLSRGKHVVVYGEPSNLIHFEALSGRAASSRLRVHEVFSSDAERDPDLDAETELALGPVRGGQGTLLLILPGLFPAPLPFADVGMVVSLVTNFHRKIYDDMLYVVASSRMGQSWRSLESQRWTGWGYDGRAAGGAPLLIEAIAGDPDRYTPGDEVRIKDGTHDPLRECFAMAAAYPGTALNLLPIFGAVSEPRDLAVRLRIMGLLVEQGDGFILTNKGERARYYMGQDKFLTLETATALAGIDVGRMGEKVARSILRLALVKDLAPTFVVDCQMKLQGDDAFATFLRHYARELRYGGPGRELIDRGMTWLIWVAFESVAYSVAAAHGVVAETMLPGPDFPLYCETDNLQGVMGTVQSWERFLKLDPINDNQRGDWDTPLSPAEVAIVEEEIARANYSTLLDIPIAVKREGQAEPKPLSICWLRTKQPVALQGDFDEHLLATRTSIVDGMQSKPARQYVFFGALPMEISKGQYGDASVTGLMWLPYDLIKSLVGDLRAEDADPRLRKVMLGQ